MTDLSEAQALARATHLLGDIRDRLAGLTVEHAIDTVHELCTAALLLLDPFVMRPEPDEKVDDKLRSRQGEWSDAEYFRADL